MEELKLADKVEVLWNEQNSGGSRRSRRKNKVKEMRIPAKGKVSRGKLKKGFLTVIRFDDNKNIAFEKKPLQEGTYRLSTGEYHTTREEDIFFYKGKPVVFQSTKKINPYNPLSGKNETYGQKMVMARMLGDAIKIKSKTVGIGIIIVAIIGIIIAINYFGGGGA